MTGPASPALKAAIAAYKKAKAFGTTEAFAVANAKLVYEAEKAKTA